MKARILLPLFAALVFSGTARSQNPEQPRPDGPAPDRASPERLKHKVEDLKREGKPEEAERLEHKAKELMERHREGAPRENKAGGNPEARREAPKAERREEPRREEVRREVPPNPAPARHEAPGQARKEGAFQGGPIADRIKGRMEQLRRDGKGEQAENFAKHAREMWEQRRGNAQGKGGAESHGDKPAVSPGERAGHLAEAAKHLRAAGINVPPEMLEKLGQRAGAQGGNHPWFSHRSPQSPGDHAARPQFPPKDGAAPNAGSHFDAMRKHFAGRSERPASPPVPNPAPGAGSPGQHPFPPMTGPAPGGSRVDAMHSRSGVMPQRPSFSHPANPAPGAGAPSDSVQNQIRALAQQVQELRSMLQQQRGGMPNPGPQGGALHRQNPGEHHDNPGRPHAEGRPQNPPGHPVIPGDRPRGDAPQRP